MTNKSRLGRFLTVSFFALNFLISTASAADITQAQAETALEAALKKAQAQGTLMNIAVVDAGANLKTFVRMDNAFLGSVDIAIKKAKTARYFNMPTGELGKLSQPGGPVFNIELSNGGLVTFPGGVPLKNAEGEIIGAIGVSGGTIEDDHEVAMAAVHALSKGGAQHVGNVKALKHIVALKFNEEVTQAQKDEAIALLLDFPNQIPEVKSVEGGKNVTIEDNHKGFTHVLSMTFENQAGLKVYLPHEHHLAVVERLGPLVADVFVVDYFVH